METKLTLKLNQSIIQSAKKYAKNNNKSLSKLVEDFFKNLISEKNLKKKYTPLVKELSGVITEKDIKKQDYISYLEKKYE